MKEGVDKVTLEAEHTIINQTEHASVRVCVRVHMHLCAYLSDLSGAPQQVVDVVVELQLPLGSNVFDVCSTKDHLVGETTNRGHDHDVCRFGLHSNSGLCASAAL